MSAVDIYLNIAYLAYVIAPAIKNELWLRVLLMGNALAFVGWGIWIDNSSVIFWNLLFSVISAFAIVRLLRERRPVALTEELERIKNELFPSISNRDFLLFWSLGETMRSHTEPITIQGSAVDSLFLLMHGTAGVFVDGVKVATLGDNQFIGEMAFVSGQPASATVEINDSADLHRWTFADLEALRTLEPHLLSPLLGSVNRDLATKLRA